MKTKLFILLLIVFSFQAEAQTQSIESHKKAIFVEAYGQGLHASVNFDMRFVKGVPCGLGFRLGVGGIFTGTSNADAGTEATGVVAFPAGLNYLIGEKKSSVEAGLGVMPYYARTDIYSPTNPEMIDKNGWGTNGYLNLGYRFQPIGNGFMFRLNWTPVISSTGFLAQNFGVSAGYSF
ncbi:hypothetical protein H9Q13_11595 [Pontibacter sp. JH31]|uniref:Outer membrane protein beta-barrel domain-containing protein n=1 Tax=Pontibacter aquaedesilientis TaxID=2766980 RepID=A0ABR7XHU0_9BACT|nr:hypothetical protein [Pontibacter aquaedesilientis]MBD1397809.1 hypothetical protein [Pontibacter aquaedesilientis]